MQNLCRKAVNHNFKNQVLVTWLAPYGLSHFEQMFKIWPTNGFSKAKSWNFHFHKNDDIKTWPLSASGLFRHKIVKVVCRSTTFQDDGDIYERLRPSLQGSRQNFCTDKSLHGSTLCLHSTGGTGRIFERLSVQVWDLKKEGPQTCTLGRSNIRPVPPCSFVIE